MTSENQGWVLITGVSTGIGRECARYLASRGFSILASARKLTDVEPLQKQFPSQIHPLQLDVTDLASVAAAAEIAGKTAGESGLRALVNNAGIGVVGPVEFTPIDEWRRQFEVNLFGQIAVTQAMLPLLRKHAAARIVLIGSIAGRISQPILAPYCASKHAMEAIADALRLELKPQGIQTSLIEPGAIESEIWRKGQESGDAYPTDNPAYQWYGPHITAVKKTAAKSARSAAPAIKVARAVERCIIARRAPARIVVGRDARMGAIMRRFLPDRLFDVLIAKAFGI